MIDGWGIFCVIAPGWSSPNLTDDKSISAQFMAWCHQVTKQYLNQCCPSSISPYGITMPQCVNQHIPQHHIPQHQYELKLNKMVTKITISSKVTPFNGRLYGLTSVRNFAADIMSFSCTEIIQHSTIPLAVVAKNCIAICMPWVSNWDMSHYLAIITVFAANTCSFLITNFFFKIILFHILVLYQNWWVTF